MTHSSDIPYPIIRGIGSDIIEITRIRESLHKHGEHFYNKLFTEQEQEYCLKHADPAIPFAGRFAAKEAIAKSLGTGFGKMLAWLDIEIQKDELGKPIVILCPSILTYFNNPTIHLTISHCHTYATATAIHTS